VQFLDEVTIHVRAGNGGKGCVAFRREKYVPKGGPSGGDGGHGGDVALVGDEGLNTLYHLSLPAIYSAERGRPGLGSNKTGKSGLDLDIRVPLGTQAYDAETGEALGEVVAQGERLVVAHGGRGGRGNARFKTNAQKAPRYAQPGIPGVEKRLRLELKLLADVGVVGLPNAGKSTLIAAISAARPKIADYPFTTLVPQLGVVAAGPYDSFVIADLPGLIAGAAEGAGLGIQFLRHVERCRVLLHLVELADPEVDPAAALATVEHELEAFDPALLERPRLVVGSKLDAAAPRKAAKLKKAVEKRRLPYHEISAATGAGIPELVFRVRELMREAAELALPKAVPAVVPLAVPEPVREPVPERLPEAGEPD
jgi:GTP-binding protein